MKFVQTSSDSMHLDKHRRTGTGRHHSRSGIDRIAEEVVSRPLGANDA